MKKCLYSIYKMGGWACIITALILTLLRVGTPSLSLPPYFSKWLTIKLQYPVLIHDIKLNWEGLGPSVLLSNVQILTNDGLPALHIQKLKMRFDLLKLLVQKNYLEELTIEGLVGGLDYQQGVISVKNLHQLTFNLDKNKNGSAQLPIVKELWIKNSHLEIAVNQDNVICLTNTDVHIEIANLIKINVLLKDDSNSFPGETWELVFSKIAKNSFIGQAVAKEVDLGKWQDRLNKGFDWLKPYNMQGRVKALVLNFDENHGQLKCQSENKQIDYPLFFLQPLLFKDLALLLDWQRNVNGFDLHMKGQVNVLDVPLKGEGKLSFLKGKTVPDIDMILELGNTSTENILKLFPQKIMDHELVVWLNSAVSEGEHVTTTCVLRGNLKEFPFDKAQGVFEAYTELDNLNFNYYPKKHPQWPVLTNLKASLHFNNQALHIFSKRGNVMTGELIGADATIPDLFVKTPELIVDTKIASSLSEALMIVENSPLPKNLIKTLSPLTLKGSMTLSLGLKMPLSTKSTNDIQVSGLIELHDAIVSTKKWPYTINNLKGDVSFTQNSIKSSNLSGLLLEMPSQFTIDFEKQNEIKITAQGNIEIEKLQNVLNRELKNIQGTTDYYGELSLFPQDDFQATLNMTSSLKGIRIEAPYPLAKEQQTIKPIELKAYLEPNQSMRFMGKYGDINLATSFVLNENAQCVGAHLHFGDTKPAKFREDHVLLIDGEISHLDFPSWKAHLAEVIDSKNENTQALEPLIELNIGALSLYGANFDKQKIEAHYEHDINQWHVSLDGPTLKGVVKIPKSESSALIVDLQKLALKSGNDQPGSLNKTPNTHAIDIKIKELIWGNKLISDIQARLEPSWKGYFFSNAIAKIKENEVTLSGNWDYLFGQNKVSTTGKIVIKDIKETLNVLGLKGSVQKGKGLVDFDLNWQGTPSKIDYPTLAGQATFFLSEGVIQGMNPGIGRVLNLLNLDNVKRRLNLDFSDVTKDGFVFNELNGKFQFAKGKIVSNKVILQGPSAKIEAFGQADLENQALDGEVVVMPNVTGSLPVAVAIAAGNPAVGAAFWAVDKMFGHKIQEIHRVRYKVLGTWDAPKVEEILLQVKGLPFETALGG